MRRRHISVSDVTAGEYHNSNHVTQNLSHKWWHVEVQQPFELSRAAVVSTTEHKGVLFSDETFVLKDVEGLTDQIGVLWRSWGLCSIAEDCLFLDKWNKPSKHWRWRKLWALCGGHHMKDSWMKVCEVTETVGSSTEQVHNILCEKAFLAMGAAFVDCRSKTQAKGHFNPRDFFASICNFGRNMDLPLHTRI